MKVKVVDCTNQLYAYSCTFSSSTFVQDAFGCLIVASPVEPICLESKDLILEGSADDFGDRACEHVRLEGELYELAPTLMSATSSVLHLNSCGATAPCMAFTYDYFNGKWRTKTMLGYLAINGSGPDFFIDVPDCLSGTRQCKDAYLKSWTTADKHLHREWYCLWRTSSSSPWVVISGSSEVEFDFPNHRYKVYPNTYWTDMYKLRLATSKPTGLPILPTTWREYERLEKLLNLNYVQPADYLVYGDLARRCANDAVVISTNSIALVKELREFTETLKGVYDLSKGKVDVKKIASAYLSYKYGAILTVKDVKSVMEAMTFELTKARTDVNRTRSKEIIYTPPNSGVSLPSLITEYCYKITYAKHSTALKEALALWYDSGLFPSFETIWDLTPLSFVVDWFVSSADYFNAVDASNYWQLHDIEAVCYSKKRTYPDVSTCFFSTWGTFIGDASATFYSRSISPIIHKPSFFESTPRIFKNYAELSALIVVLSDI